MVRRSATGAMPVTSSPPMVIRPEDGSISQLIILRVVLLPQPEGSTCITVSPAASSRVTSSTAGAWLSGQRLVRLSSRILALAAAGRSGPADRADPSGPAAPDVGEVGSTISAESATGPP